MQNTDGLNTSYDISLSGESSAYFDSLTANNLVISRLNPPSYLGPTINVNELLSNCSFDVATRQFTINSDDPLFDFLSFFDCSNNYIEFYPMTMSINPAISLNFICNNINFFDSDVLFENSTIDLNPVVTSITINNFGFAAPAQGLNSFSTISSPYTSINDWTISLVSGTAPSVFIGRGFTSLVNLYETAFPEYPYFTQYVSFQAPSIYQMSFTQSLTFATTGNYILTFYIWGEYSRYSPTNNISVSCGNNSITNFTGSEGAWKKVIMKFQITTAGSNTLTILVNNTSGTDSGISFSGVQIVRQTGLVVYDGGNTNNQLITTKGLYTSGFINNQGNIENYGNFINYGPLNLVAPYSAGTLVIGSSLFGTTNSDTGRYSTLIGSQIVVNAGYTPVNLNACLFIGYGSGEQAINSTRNHGIGYQSNRWAISGCNDNVGYGYQSNYSLGYSGNTNCSSNTSIGNFCLSGAYTSNNFLNTVIGFGSISGVDFTNSRSCNSVCGAVSLQVIASNFNSSLGYNNANGILNTSSDRNVFIGTNVCNTQDGNGNVLSSCTFLGSDSNVSASGNYSNSTCLGASSKITGSNQIILGTASEITYAMGGLTIPVSTNLKLLGNITAVNIANKVNLETNQTLTGTSINLTFETAENVLLTNATTTTINLPTPNVDGRNEGTKFYINRKVAGVLITINAPSGQNVAYYQSNGTYITASSYLLRVGDASITFLCVGSAASGANWQVIFPSISQATDSLYLGTTNPYASTALSIPFGGTTTAGYQPLFMDNANLNYKQSTSTLTATNISCASLTATTTFKANATVIFGNVYSPYQTGAISGAATALPGAPTELYGNYFWTASTTASTNTVITLPTITVAMVGCELSFRRITTFSTNTLIIKTPAGGATIMNRNSVTTTAANTNYTLIDTTATITGNYARIVAYTTSQWIVMF